MKKRDKIDFVMAAAAGGFSTLLVGGFGDSLFLAVAGGVATGVAFFIWVGP